MKSLLTAVLCLSVSLATFPVAAYQDCGENGSAHHEHADHAEHQTAQKHKHSSPDGAGDSCCLAHTAQAILLNPVPTPSLLAKKSGRLDTPERILLSQPLLLQERPPKHSC